MIQPPSHKRDVLRLDDGRMKTLEEIGQIFDVTRERIRQIEAKACAAASPQPQRGAWEYIK